jgi:hypothetical protein
VKARNVIRGILSPETVYVAFAFIVDGVTPPIQMLWSYSVGSKTRHFLKLVCAQ